MKSQCSIVRSAPRTMRGTAAALATLTTALAAPLAHAGIGVAAIPCGAPPSFVPFGSGAGQPITYAPLDPRPLFLDVGDVPVAPGVSITFDDPANHRRIGTGWSTWCHGFTGDVYWSNGATSMTMRVSAPATGVDYFGFSVTTNPFGTFDVNATGFDQFGASVGLTQAVTSGTTPEQGGWGFYTTGLSVVDHVIVSSDVDFAAAEFGIHKAPAPGSLATIALAGALAARRRR